MVIAATMLAAQSIQLGTNDVVVAGGMESMSNVPKYLAEARSVLHLIWLSLRLVLVVAETDSVLKLQERIAPRTWFTCWWDVERWVVGCL